MTNECWEGYFKFVEGHPFNHRKIINRTLCGIYPTNSAIASQCDYLNKGIIPEGVTTISDYAFYQSSLETITFPSSLTHIDNFAFSKCNRLKKVILNNGVHLGYWCFSNCSELEEVHIKTKIVPGYCFYNCLNLKHLYLYGTEYIDLTALMKSDGGLIEVTLHAEEGSYVESFAKENNIKFLKGDKYGISKSDAEND